MSRAYRQDVSRFDDIEVGDTVTWIEPGERFGHYSRKVTSFEGDVAILGGSNFDVRVTRANFWALRKAPGKGKSGARRFSATDAVVSCQVCGGSWIGNTGRLPHHGYQRPGDGQQTSSCPGALHYAYAVEADPRQSLDTIGRDVLPRVIDSYDDWIARTEKRLADVIAGTIPLPSEVRPTTLAQLRDHANPKYALVPPAEQPRYAARQKAVRRETESELDDLRRYRAYLQERFDSWKPGGTDELGNDVLTAPTALPAVSR